MPNSSSFQTAKTNATVKLAVGDVPIRRKKAYIPSQIAQIDKDIVYGTLASARRTNDFTVHSHGKIWAVLCQ